MDEKIIYRPYRTDIFFAHWMISISLISLVISGMLLRGVKNIEVFIFLGVGCSGIALAHYFFVLSKVMIVFEEDGLRIINDRRAKYYVIPWEEMLYGYYERNYRGHRFLVLSAGRLSKKQVKKLVNKGANSSKVCFDTAVVIYLDSMQDTSRIKGIIEQNTTLMFDE